MNQLSIARQLFLMQLAVILVVTVIGAVFAYNSVVDDSKDKAARTALGVAQTLAQTPTVRNAMTQPNPTAALQSLTAAVSRAAGVEYVIVLNTNGIHYTAGDPTEIGKKYSQGISQELHGHTVIDEYVEPPVGLRVRAQVPLYGSNSRIIGVVAVATHTQFTTALCGRIPPLFGILGGACVLTALGAFFVTRRLKRQTLGLGPTEITSMYEHHDAVLHAVRDGLLVMDPGGRLALTNDEARRLLNLDLAAEGHLVSELAVPGSIGELLVSERSAKDEIHLVRDRVLLVSQIPVRKDGRLLGTVTTLRDRTELQALMGELDSVRKFAEALRAQTHEADNRLHTVIMLVELGKTEQAVEFATAELAMTQQLTERLLTAVEEPPLAALLLGKIATAHESGIELSITPDTAVHSLSVDVRDLITLVGNLIDNAIDAALAAPPPRRVVCTVRQDEDTLFVRVADSGTGLDPQLVHQAFTRGWSTKSTGRLHSRGLGLALVGQVVSRYNGTIEVTNNDGAVFTVRLPHVALTAGTRH